MIIISLQIVIWFQVFLSNTINFQKALFDTSGQIGPGSYSNER